MRWEIEHIIEKGIIYIKTEGTLSDVKQNSKMILEAIEKAKKNNVYKCLIDDRKLELNIGTANIYFLPEDFEKLGVNRSYKVAIVLAIHPNNIDDYKFYETRAKNMGYQHKIFSDIASAESWLISK
jgi:hypothetical protein